MQPRQPIRSDVPPQRTATTDRPNEQPIMVRVLVVLLIILALSGLIWFGTKALSAAMSNANVRGKEFQAVFLSNGQVYFGKLTRVNNDYVKLTNIYYLQVSNNGSQSSAQSGSNTGSEQQASLAKLGNELHGPEDAMYINQSQILFWENLKNSGKVAQAISNYQNSSK